MMRLQEDEVTGPRAAELQAARWGMWAELEGVSQPLRQEGGDLPRPLDHSASAKRQHLHQRTAGPGRKPGGGNQGGRNLLRIMETILPKRRQEIGEGGREG